MSNRPNTPVFLTRAQAEALRARAESIRPNETAALQRLLAIARTDTGQARRVASFLLAWWNAQSCGGFDLTDFWPVDTDIARDMVTVLGLIVRVHRYPDALGYGAEFEAIVRAWRPQLVGVDHD